MPVAASIAEWLPLGFFTVSMIVGGLIIFLKERVLRFFYRFYIYMHTGMWPP